MRESGHEQARRESSAASGRTGSGAISFSTGAAGGGVGAVGAVAGSTAASVGVAGSLIVKLSVRRSRSKRKNGARENSLLRSACNSKLGEDVDRAAGFDGRDLSRCGDRFPRGGLHVWGRIDSRDQSRTLHLPRSLSIPLTPQRRATTTIQSTKSERRKMQTTTTTTNRAQTRTRISPRSRLRATSRVNSCSSSGAICK